MYLNLSRRRPPPPTAQVLIKIDFGMYPFYGKVHVRVEMLRRRPTLLSTQRVRDVVLLNHLNTKSYE